MIFYIISALIGFLLIKYIIKPYVSLSFYKRQGLTASFFPGLGILPRIMKAMKEHGDAMYFSKNLSKINPSAKASCANFGSGTIVNIIDSELIKDFAFKDHLFEKHFPKFMNYLIGSSALSLVGGEEWKN